jgi:NTE family protein
MAQKRSKRAPRAAPSGRAVGVPAQDATPDHGDLAVVLTGGGARGAYQVGVLRYLARRYPELSIPVVTGVSAGAINAAMLAQHHGTLPQAVEEMAALWKELTPERVFRVDMPALLGRIGQWGLQLASAGIIDARPRGLVDTDPLGEMLTEALKPVEGKLTGIDYNLHRGTLRAIALGTTSYTTGQTVIWVQGGDAKSWERPERRSVHTALGVEHVMASAALPFLFPAVQIGEHWYGDGGVRSTAPIAPALHLGAHKILTISTSHRPASFEEADLPEVVGYPPPAQVLGVLYDAVFLDAVDQDVSRMQRINQLLSRIPRKKRDGLRIVDLLVIRPSRDLAALAAGLEPRLPRAFQMLTRWIGTGETERPEVLSMIMFQADYAAELIELGEADAERQADEIDAFLHADGDG